MKQIFKPLIFLLCFIPGLVFSAETNNVVSNQWNVLVDPLVNRTEGGKEASLKKVIQKSIQTFVGQVDYLKVEAGPDEVVPLDQELTRTYRAGKDVLITGSYSVVGENIYIFITVYDVVLRQLKLEKSYSGKAGANIFDTLDQVIANLKKDVTSTVKPMDEETFTKYHKRVEMVSEDIKLPRSFVTSFGWNSAFNSILPNTGLPYLALDFRLDWLNFGTTAFIPLLIPQTNTIETWANNMMTVYAGYQFANMIAGLGTFLTYTDIIKEGSDSSANLTYVLFAPMAYFQYDIGSTISMKAMLGYGSFSYYNGDFSSPIYGFNLDYYFTDNFGLKAAVYNSSHKGTYNDYNGMTQEFIAENTILLLGLNYRVDLK